MGLNKIFLKKTIFLVLSFFVVSTKSFASADSSQVEVLNSLGFENDILQWINHLEFLPGHPVVKTNFNAINPGTLVVRSTTTGDVVPGGGNKVIELSLQVPPRNLLKGVRICYKTSNPRTFIRQIRLAQLQNPPVSWLVRMDQATVLNSISPICVNSMEVPVAVNPSLGSLRLPLRFYFGNINDFVTIYAVGLWLQPF